jgi:hypothetical protein
MNRYIADSIRKGIDSQRERLFASYAVGRPENWNPCPRTKDLVCLEAWLPEELQRLAVSDTDRRTQQEFFNRWARSDDDLFELAARTLNAVLDGEIQQGRIPHRRWG